MNGELYKRLMPDLSGKTLKVLDEASKEFNLALDSHEYEKLVKKWFGTVANDETRKTP